MPFNTGIYNDYTLLGIKCYHLILLNNSRNSFKNNPTANWYSTKKHGEPEERDPELEA